MEGGTTGKEREPTHSGGGDGVALRVMVGREKDGEGKKKKKKVGRVRRLWRSKKSIKREKEGDMDPRCRGKGTVKL